MHIIRRTLFALVLLPAIACGDTASDFDGLSDGSSTVGWVNSKPSTVIEVKTYDGGNQALSVTGSEGSNSTTSLSIAPGDAGDSIGVTFKIRASHNVRFSVTTLGVVPVEQGGTCTSGCYDNHGANLALSTEWQTVRLDWNQLSQLGTGTPSPLDPAGIVFFNWTPVTEGDFNMWLDEVDLVDEPGATTTPAPATGGTPGTGGTDAGTGGADAGTGGADAPTGGSPPVSDNVFSQYVSKALFEGVYRDKDPIYTYEALVAAVDQFPGFASCCNEAGIKREIAAFMAHVQHESDFLRAANEYTPGQYCDFTPLDPTWACVPGKEYFGRGALQLTWNYNYGMAEDYFATQGRTYDLVARPEQVSASTELVWTTALWFWMEGEPGTQSMQDVFKAGGFGASIRKINGALECDGAGPTQVQQRVNYYEDWCTRLGVDPGSNLTC